MNEETTTAELKEMLQNISNELSKREEPVIVSFLEFDSSIVDNKIRTLIYLDDTFLKATVKHIKSAINHD